MTKAEYADYERSVAAWRSQNFFPSSGFCEGCEECGNTNEDSYFSWRSCEVCHRPLGGDRYPVHSVDSDDDRVVLHWDACLDCICYLEYGRLDDQTMLDMED